MMRGLARKIQEHPDGEDGIFERIADGEPIRTIALTFNVSRPMIYAWIHKTEEREKKWRAAQKIAAHGFIEDGMQILDQPLEEFDHSGEPSMRKARAEYRRWLAGQYNRDDFGKEESGAKVNVHLNVGELHLDALRQAGRATPLPRLTAEEVDDEGDS